MIHELGHFTEKDYGNAFVYTDYMDDYGRSIEATHTMLCRHGYRYIKLLKTVVYVAIDEDAEGNPIWEKWSIKNHSDYISPYPLDKNRRHIHFNAE